MKQITLTGEQLIGAVVTGYVQNGNIGFGDIQLRLTTGQIVNISTSAKLGFTMIVKDNIINS